MSTSEARCLVRVHARQLVAEGVIAVELRALTGVDLPAFTAGAHIDVVLPVQDPAGHEVVRQYSLCNDPAERHRYVVAVARDAASRGGSAWLHDRLRTGDVLTIAGPRNHFPLDEQAPRSVLIAGGIGVTPLLAMARRLAALGRPWQLYLCARTPERAAFVAEASALPGGEVITVFDGVAGGRPLDLAALCAGLDPDTHLYCCGPTPMLAAFEAATGQRPPGTVHVEYFKAREVEASAQGTFELKLARSGRTLHVPADRSILDVLADAGIDVPYSCRDGVCGTCETRVLDGLPAHRCSVLLGDQAEATDRLMPCVSRSRSPLLTLDL